VGTPDAGAFWRVIAEHGVVALFTAPTAFRAIKKEDPQGTLLANHDLSSFRTLFLAGERADPDTIQWAERLLQVPVIDHWWQTETGWPIAANLMGLERCRPSLDLRPSRCPVATCGWWTRPRPRWRGGGREIVIRLPLPPGCLPTLWGDDQRYVSHTCRGIPATTSLETGDSGTATAICM
jgi:propionyl-CoA synthetase